MAASPETMHPTACAEPVFNSLPWSGDGFCRNTAFGFLPLNGLGSEFAFISQTGKELTLLPLSCL